VRGERLKDKGKSAGNKEARPAGGRGNEVDSWESEAKGKAGATSNVPFAQDPCELAAFGPFFARLPLPAFRCFPRWIPFPIRAAKQNANCRKKRDGQLGPNRIRTSSLPSSACIPPSVK
jgi:hypothetical protein